MINENIFTREVIVEKAPFEVMVTNDFIGQFNFPKQIIGKIFKVRCGLKYDIIELKVIPTTYNRKLFLNHLSIFGFYVITEGFYIGQPILKQSAKKI